MDQKIISLSEFKTTASQLLEEVGETNVPIILTQHGRVKAVVENYGTYEKNRRAMLILKMMVQSEADIQNGQLVEQNDVFEGLNKKLTTKQHG